MHYETIAELKRIREAANRLLKQDQTNNKYKALKGRAFIFNDTASCFRLYHYTDMKQDESRGRRADYRYIYVHLGPSEVQAYISRSVYVDIDGAAIPNPDNDRYTEISLRDFETMWKEAETLPLKYYQEIKKLVYSSKPCAL